MREYTMRVRLLHVNFDRQNLHEANLYFINVILFHFSSYIR